MQDNQEINITLNQALEKGLEFHNVGEYAHAESIYTQILDFSPKLPEVLRLLSMAIFAQNRQDEAFEFLDRAILLAPESDEYIATQAEFYRNMGDLPKAQRSLEKALKLNPGNYDITYNLALVCNEQGDENQAISILLKLSTVSPDLLPAFRTLGRIFAAKGNYPDAIKCYKHCITLDPENSDWDFELGNIYVFSLLYRDACKVFRSGLNKTPKSFKLTINLASAYQYNGEYSLSIQHFLNALKLQPLSIEIYENLSKSLAKSNRVQEAIDFLKKGAKKIPEAWRLRFKQEIYKQQISAWNEEEELTASDYENLVASEGIGLCDPFDFVTLNTTAKQQYICAAEFAKGKDVDPVIERKPRSNNSAKIKIGYICGEFRGHATTILLAGLMEQHDRSKFEIVLYSTGPGDDSEPVRRISDAVDNVVDLFQLPEERQIALIADDEIDILIDLNGYTGNSPYKILFSRVAPIQINYLGYPGTMGSEKIDYLIADHHIIPESLRCYYSEKIAYLPQCYQANDRSRKISETEQKRSDYLLPETGFVFCCFNAAYKITAEVFSIWMRLLDSVPDSVLWLLAGPSEGRKNLLKEAENRGIDPDRIVFAHHADPDVHLARHQLADLFVDTFPVNAHTTASDSLWGGCPVVTCGGETFVSRVAGSMLKSIGLSEMVTESLTQYEELALDLALNPEKLDVIRSRLKTNRLTTDLYDTEKFTRNFEKGLEEIWQNHLQGNPPKTFDI